MPSAILYLTDRLSLVLPSYKKIYIFFGFLTPSNRERDTTQGIHKNVSQAIVSSQLPSSSTRDRHYLVGWAGALYMYVQLFPWELLNVEQRAPPNPARFGTVNYSCRRTRALKKPSADLLASDHTFPQSLFLRIVDINFYRAR